jgi:hypothetical protein
MSRDGGIAIDHGLGEVRGSRLRRAAKKVTRALQIRFGQTGVKASQGWSNLVKVSQTTFYFFPGGTGS